MFNKLKQFKDLRTQAKAFRDKLAQEVIETDSHWGKLKVRMDGNMTVQSLTIDESLLDAKNKQNLEKELQELFNNAVEKVQKKLAQTMAKDGNLPNLADFLK